MIWSFAAMIAASVAVTGAAPICAILFSVAAALLSNIRAIKACAPAAVVLLIALSATTMPITIAAIVWACCITTAFTVKKNYYYSFPLLLVITFIISVAGICKGNPLSLAQLGLIFLLPCAAATAPANKIKGLCVALAVSLPITFGGGRIQTVCLLLPALVPVLLDGARRIESKEGE